MIDKEKPFFELSKIKDMTSEILEVVFIKNYSQKKEYKVDTDVFTFKQEGKEYYILISSLPGLNRENIEVDVKEDIVTIKAKRELFFPAEMIKLQDDMLRFITENAVSIENYYGIIHRQIKLPKKVKKQEGKAIYAKGLLFIKLECE